MIVLSVGSLFLLWALIYVGQLRKMERPRRKRELGRWLSFHGGVK
jgi:hypothetical protein